MNGGIQYSKSWRDAAILHIHNMNSTTWSCMCHEVYNIWWLFSVVTSRICFTEYLAREVGEQGMMGREKRRRRLGNPVFKMADVLMAEHREISNLENRPFHRAYLVRKLPCPHVHCTAQLGEAFFEETGLVQHYRVKHAADHRAQRSQVCPQFIISTTLEAIL